jgi:regulator of replication initiation timing
MTARMNRRLFGMLSKRLDELGLDEIDDTRDDRGKRWRLGALLRATLGAMVAGAKSLAKVEDLSARMSQPTRRLLGIRKRLPDTTLRNALCTIEPDKLRSPLHALVRKAQRRKALEPDELPFGIVSLDGKGFSIPSSDDWYAQRQTPGEDASLTGIVRTVTATLTSSAAKPIIDVTPIPAHTNEMGVLRAGARCAVQSLSRGGSVPARHLRRGRLLGTQRKSRARPRFALLIRSHRRPAHAPARGKTLARLAKCR